MPDEHNNTRVSLRDYVDQSVVETRKYFERRNDELGRFFESRIESLERATRTASDQMDKRLEGMNEFRETLREQAATFVTRTELEARKEMVDRELKALEKYKNQMEGKASQLQANISLAFSLVALVLAIVKLVT